jgi:hypothetical protein
MVEGVNLTALYHRWIGVDGSSPFSSWSINVQGAPSPADINRFQPCVIVKRPFHQGYGEYLRNRLGGGRRGFREWMGY